ncbi:N-acetylmuramate alpha-1-phosphate uridylyltransferase MurU [Methylomonas koyamae]|uniref:N-acetylmuramate alpha-1-phosphate uridylyltransferase MurU n=1 Tax=Methylomonas koyamae TaxID=702114 RepID=UPI00112792F5|nr:nucleotidyltransferase family protein [Methylomonas koyamae]TPQ27029.1 mannose-1-phosphate guanylyltransferase [Methylomonas koyamae]
MKAMILAAGRGERMRPLTDHTPKPLLRAAGKPLIEYTLENLAAAGFTDIVINIAHLGALIKNHCGNGARWGLSIAYSDEGETALETAGGIAKALPLLGDTPFLAINADIVCDCSLRPLRDVKLDLAHLVMIDNPPHHPEGDFALTDSGLLAEQGETKLTFSGIGLYHPELFKGVPAAPLKLRPVLNRAIQQQRISGQKHSGIWLDIGTPDRLEHFSNMVGSERAPIKT